MAMVESKKTNEKRVPNWLAKLGVNEGGYYTNTKARAKRMMRNSLSSEARRVYACLELGTMGFQQECAIKLDRGRRVPLAPVDICEQTGLSKQHVRRAIEELEAEGLAERRPIDDGKGLTKGNVAIYSWAVPRAPKGKNGSQRAATILPPWFPESWAPLRSLISHYKYRLPEDLGSARGYLSAIEDVARDYQRVEKEARALLERVCAGERPNKEEINGKKHIERNNPPPPQSVVNGSSTPPPPQPRKAEEEEGSSYQKLKTKYPPNRFDDSKAKPAFERLTRNQQARVIARLDVYLQCERWVRSLADDEGRFIPLASNWLPQCEAEPPPYMAPPGRRGASEEEVLRLMAQWDRHAKGDYSDVEGT